MVGGRYDRYVNVTVRREVYEALREAASREGVSVPELIARLVEGRERCFFCRSLVGVGRREVAPGEELPLCEECYGKLSSIVRRAVDVLGGPSKSLLGSPSKSSPVPPSNGGGRLSWVADKVRRRKVVLLSELKLTKASPGEVIEAVEGAGHVALDGARGDVALVDKEFWEEFKARLPQLPRSPVLDGAEAKLFNFLKENALIYYDSSEGWKLT